jgi:hypothetical protein
MRVYGDISKEADLKCPQCGHKFIDHFAVYGEKSYWSCNLCSCTVLEAKEWIGE